MKGFNRLWAPLLAMTTAVAFSNTGFAQQQRGPIVMPVTEISATVESTDLDNRTLALNTAEGRLLDLKIGKSVRGFDELRKGDQVSVQYIEPIALRFSTEPTPAAEFARFTEVSPPGERPTAVTANTLQIAATVEEVSIKPREVTVRDPGGESMTLAVGPDTEIDQLNPGDQVLVTYSEAIATSVRKAS